MPFLQILSDSGVSANWVMVIMTGITGFLLIVLGTIVSNHFINALKDIRDDLRIIKDQIMELRLTDAEQEARLTSLESKKK